MLALLSAFVNKQRPVNIVIGGYFAITLTGFLFLCCPLLQKVATGALDNLFIATSAISTTGLTSVSVADNYNFWGQLIVVLLIQIGGLHYMTFGSVIMMTRRKKLSKLHETLIKSDFGLPDDFDIYDFLKSVIVFSLAVEAVGAVFLYIVFSSHGVVHPLWNAVFHSVSAFCTAGFSLFNTSFEGFAGDPLLNIVIFILSFLGAIGFIVVTDFWRMATGRQKSITFTTKIILSFTVLVIAVGTLLIFLMNSFNANLPLALRAWMSLFQSMTALTTVGFDTFPIANMSHGAVYLLAVLMLIGASPAGTGGGIKSTTVVAVVAQMIATLKGKVNVTFMGHQIPSYRLRLASANFTFYIIILAGGIYFLSLADNHSIFEVIFEATSALGTVGLSLGITGALTAMGKAVIISLMMLGRLGPLAIGMALFQEKDGMDDLGWHEDVVI